MFQLFEEFDILFIKRPAVARLAGGNIIRMVEFQLLFPALAVDIVAFDLVSGSGAAPEESFREGEGRKFVKIEHDSDTLHHIKGAFGRACLFPFDEQSKLKGLIFLRRNCGKGQRVKEIVPCHKSFAVVKNFPLSVGNSDRQSCAVAFDKIHIDSALDGDSFFG